MNDLTIACCSWKNFGGEWQNEYVNRLYRAIKRNLRKSFRFVCFTDDLSLDLDTGIETLELNVPSYVDILPKCILYNPDNGLSGRIIGMDLDTVIVGSLDNMFSYSGFFCVRKCFGPKTSRRYWGIGGDMVGFEAGFGAELIWKRLVNETDKIELITGGDERELYKFLVYGKVQIDFWQDLYPGQYFSYKNHLRGHRGRLPKESRIVSFHGRPRPHECLGVPWVRENWK